MLIEGERGSSAPSSFISFLRAAPPPPPLKPGKERRSYLVHVVTEGQLLSQFGLGHHQAHACVSGDRFNQFFFSDWEMIGQDGTESWKSFS